MKLRITRRLMQFKNEVCGIIEPSATIKLAESARKYNRVCSNNFLRLHFLAGSV
jgi:hypothetical protein